MPIKSFDRRPHARRAQRREIALMTWQYMYRIEDGECKSVMVLCLGLDTPRLEAANSDLDTSQHGCMFHTTVA